MAEFSLSRRTFVAGASTALGMAQVKTAAIGNSMRPPDLIALHSGSQFQQLSRTGEEWRFEDIAVRTQSSPASLAISVSAERSGLEHILFRWRMPLPTGAEFLGDHWERSYGDLAWRSSVPNRIMPWYFLMTDGRLTSGFGVRVGAPTLAFWQADPKGISLWLDLRNGGSAVQLAGRTLEAIHVVTINQKDGNTFTAARQLCEIMSLRPRLPKSPVYGGNNWYYTYGENFAAADIVRDGELLAECANSATNRPYMVVDMGWERADEGAGPTRETNDRFPDMAGLVAQLKKIDVRPGIWLRPLLTTEKLAESWRMAGSAKRMKDGFFVIDPSIPEALAHVKNSVKVVKEWGFKLIKHDFSTYDMLGGWGFDMGASLTDPELELRGQEQDHG